MTSVSGNNSDLIVEMDILLEAKDMTVEVVSVDVEVMEVVAYGLEEDSGSEAEGIGEEMVKDFCKSWRIPEMITVCPYCS